MEEDDKILEELHQLEDEHRSLDAIVLGLGDAQGGFDQLQLQRLKKRKLWLKDRIALLHDILHPDIIA